MTNLIESAQDLLNLLIEEGNSIENISGALEQYEASQI